MSGVAPLTAGYKVSLRRTRLKVFVLLTPALTGESPTYILREAIPIPRNTRDRSITRSLQSSVLI